MIWDDGIFKTCIVDNANCSTDKICVTADHLPRMLILAREHALKCPNDMIQQDCPVQYEDTLEEQSCDVDKKRCFYNSYCCPLCEGDPFAKCGYLHESICLDGMLFFLQATI